MSVKDFRKKLLKQWTKFKLNRNIVVKSKNVQYVTVTFKLKRL